MFLENFAKAWKYYTYDMADPRTRDRFLMGSPLPIISLCIFYVIFNNYILKGYMRDRKPFNIRYASIVYNFYLMSACIMFSYKLSYFWFVKYNWWCEPVDQSNSDEALEVVEICYCFLLVKISCVIESFLIEIGKKNVLRWQYIVIHHATLPFVIWVGVNYSPGGHSTFFAFILSTSAVFYLAYIVTVLTFPEWKKNLLWWEAIILPVQIGQFILIIVHGIQPLFFNPCNFPLVLIYFCLVYGVLLLILFVGYIWTISVKRSKMKTLTKHMDA